MSGLRYEGIAQMPMNIQQRVVPVIDDIRRRQVAAVMRKKEAESEKRTVLGMQFKTEAAANRCRMLLDAENKGVICDLRIWHRIPMENAHFTSEGKKVPAEFFLADFTYRLKDHPDAPVELEIMAERMISLMDIQRLRKMGYTVREV